MVHSSTPYLPVITASITPHSAPRILYCRWKVRSRLSARRASRTSVKSLKRLMRLHTVGSNQEPYAKAHLDCNDPANRTDDNSESFTTPWAAKLLISSVTFTAEGQLTKVSVGSLMQYKSGNRNRLTVSLAFISRVADKHRLPHHKLAWG